MAVSIEHREPEHTELAGRMNSITYVEVALQRSASVTNSNSKF